MKTGMKLAVVWVAYTSLFVLGTGAYRGQWLLILFIYLGSLFGMFLPKLIQVASALLQQDHVILDARFFSTFWHEMARESRDVIPTTRIGKLLYSYPFLFAFELVSFYIVTSSADWFGKALVLGMGLQVSFDLFIHSSDLSVLRRRWFSYFPANLTDTELKIFVCATGACLLLFTLLAIKT